MVEEQQLHVNGGTIAYGVSGETGPLVVAAHGMGDSRAAFRFLSPLLVEAGYRVVSVDLRGCGGSSPAWPSYTRTDIAGDLVELVVHLGGGPVVLLGHSISGGAVTIAAATAPELVTAAVEIAPFTRKQDLRVRDLRVARFRRATRRLLGAVGFGSKRNWLAYLDLAYPGPTPPDWQERRAEIAAMLGEPGRMKAVQAMGKAAPTDAGEQLPNVRCPVLVIQGSADPDWVDPEAEGRRIVAALPTGLGHLTVIDGAGHYPHVQHPAETASAVVDFLDGLDLGTK